MYLTDGGKSNDVHQNNHQLSIFHIRALIKLIFCKRQIHAELTLAIDQQQPRSINHDANAIYQQHDGKQHEEPVDGRFNTVMYINLGGNDSSDEESKKDEAPQEEVKHTTSIQGEGGASRIKV